MKRPVLVGVCLAALAVLAAALWHTAKSPAPGDADAAPSRPAGQEASEASPEAAGDGDTMEERAAALLAESDSSGVTYEAVTYREHTLYVTAKTDLPPDYFDDGTKARLTEAFSASMKNGELHDIYAALADRDEVLCLRLTLLDSDGGEGLTLSFTGADAA